MSSSNTILAVRPLGFPWVTKDPFLFCVHHNDAYPAGDERLAPQASLAGRDIGQDFSGKDGWSLYHGSSVPGFPQHPHRGFETVTLVRRGFIDHSDSLGATARFGGGDAQWLTAGSGIVHCEMFPLLNRDAGNPVELFQIWLNLHSTDKMADPHFAMLWNEGIPKPIVEDAEGRKVALTIVAGSYETHRPQDPPPRSWARRPESDVAIWSLRFEPRATFTLEAASISEANRTLYFFAGESLSIDGERVTSRAAIDVDPGRSLKLQAGDSETELLMLQGRPIGERVAQFGPFVMNSEAEIQRAFADYRRTAFGGWPWPIDDPVHPRETGRFAKHADGRIERR